MSLLVEELSKPIQSYGDICESRYDNLPKRFIPVRAHSQHAKVNEFDNLGKPITRPSLTLAAVAASRVVPRCW
jgi:hypothetical protein